MIELIVYTFIGILIGYFFRPQVEAVINWIKVKINPPPKS